MKYATLNPIAAVGLNALPAAYEKTENVDEAEALLLRSFVMHEMAFSPNLKCVARAGAGVNNIPLDKLAELGVVVFNTPGANANSVKELTIAALLLAARDIRGGMQWISDNKGDENIAKTMEKAKSKFGGHEILGKTLGVIGLGAIGVLVANAASALGMKVVGYDPFLSDKVKALLDPEVRVVTDLSGLYPLCDYVTVHVPENDATRGMLNADAFSEMKDGAVLLNLARAGLVNDDDLGEALASGKILRYVTDVPSYKAANFANVLAFPHLGASTEEAEDNCAIMAAKELVDFMENGNVTHSVNYPDLTLGPKEGSRVAVTFREGADEEALKCAVKGFSKFGIKAKKGYGYALFEGASLSAEAVKTVPGVISARVL